MVVVRPGPLDPAWIHALLLLVPLVLVPLALALAETPDAGARAGRLLVLAGRLQLPAAAVLAGMLLAALYGSRFLVPGARRLDIAWMQALHGTANTFGFGLAALLGWWLALPRVSSRPPAASASGSTEPPQC